jgi:hypothetical protein
MVWEAAIWVAVTLVAPGAAGWMWPRVKDRFRGRGGWIEPAAPWVHALGPVYLALVSGAVLGRDAGLYGQGWIRWLSGAGLSAAMVAGAWVTLRRFPASERPALPSPFEAVRDEARWALYRAAGALWTGAALPGVAIGLALALAEWAFGRRPWKADVWRDPRAWVPAARMLASSLLFLGTHNLWLTLLTHAAILALVQGWRLPWTREVGPAAGLEGEAPDAPGAV